MPPPTINDVLDRIVASVVALDPLVGTHPLGDSIIKLKLPVKATNISQLVPEQLIVCPSPQPGYYRRWAGSRYEQQHLCQIILIGTNNNDYLANLPQYTAIFQQLLALFSRIPADGVWNDLKPRGLRDMKGRPTIIFDRKIITDLNLDVLAIEVGVQIIVGV